MIEIKEEEIETKKSFQIINITSTIKKYISSKKITNGQVTISTKHTTTAIIVNENEPRLLRDMEKFIGGLAPKRIAYLHDDIEKRKDCPKDEPKNAAAHLKALLLGASETLPIKDGKIDLGKWQNIFFVELDGSRRRAYSLNIIANEK
ncbi:MAG: secondary thiamine-phosphate synthase enzyme YjbQ [Candidatus Peribacteraceae bacterium]|nr:secondary thiamine-phosphate synthase enzyme YjbQ [Candidatus Peribacteraceae bacterium]